MSKSRKFSNSAEKEKPVKKKKHKNDWIKTLTEDKDDDEIKKMQNMWLNNI